MNTVFIVKYEQHSAEIIYTIKKATNKSHCAKRKETLFFFLKFISFLLRRSLVLLRCRIIFVSFVWFLCIMYFRICISLCLSHPPSSHNNHLFRLLILTTLSTTHSHTHIILLFYFLSFVALLLLLLLLVGGVDVMYIIIIFWYDHDRVKMHFLHLLLSRQRSK